MKHLKTFESHSINEEEGKISQFFRGHDSREERDSKMRDFFKELDSLNFTNSIICSTIPHLASFFRNACWGVYFDPNLSCLLVHVSFVCDENVGLTNVEFIKNTKLSFNNCGDIFNSFSFFFIKSLINVFIILSIT